MMSSRCRRISDNIADHIADHIDPQSKLCSKVSETDCEKQRNCLCCIFKVLLKRGNQ